MRSEQALACHAGALHDLRVLLRDVGGEWLELGRWIGGPPLATMPWDSEMCSDQVDARGDRSVTESDGLSKPNDGGGVVAFDKQCLPLSEKSLASFVIVPGTRPRK